MAQGDYYDRRRSRAAGRLMQAVRELDLVRRRAVPAVQVNVTQEVTVKGKRPRRERAAAGGGRVDRLGAGRN